MFSPAVHSIRQRIFGQIVHSPVASDSTKPNGSDEVDILDPDTLLGADQVAFFDLKEHEDRYDILMSTNFDFSSLTYTKKLSSLDHLDIDTEKLINALPIGCYSTQKFVYRLNALTLLLDYVHTTECAHPALVAQKEALANAITVEMNELVSNGIRQWRLRSSGVREGHGLRVVRAQERRNHAYTSPLALSIMVLTAIIHTDMGASRKSCNFILSALKAILSLSGDMQGTRAQQFIQQHLRDSPNTLPTTLHFLNLPPPLQLYVTCPRCSCLFRYLDHVEVPETCTSTNVDGIVCGERLFSNHYRGGKLRRAPIRRYSHQLFETWLAELLLLPGVEDMLEAAAPSPKALMTDVWDGTFLQNFPGNGEGNFFDAPKDELRLCMLLYHDFFNPLRNKTAGKMFSIGCFYMICLNLPPDIRYDASFAYLASIVPGPSEPSMEALQLFVRPIAEEMAELYDPGVWISRTHKYPNGRQVRAAVPLGSMDTPAARGFAGFASHGHTCFCYLCSATLDRIGANTLSEFILRAVHTHRTQAAQWENASSQVLRDWLFATNGVRSCEWLRFGWWDMFAGTVIGPMHWIRNVLDKQLRRNMNWSWNLPTGIPKPPPLSRPISKLEYEWGQRALYELDQPSFAQYKLPGPLVCYLCRERGIYEAGLSTRYLMSELNLWRQRTGVIDVNGQLTCILLHTAETVPLSVTKAHYYLSVTKRPSTLQSHASVQDLQHLCRKYGLSASGPKPVLADRLIAHYVDIRVPDLPNTTDYSKPKKQVVAVLGVEVLTEVQNDMGQTSLPSWIKHPPKNFGTITHGKLQSEEYKSLALVSFVLTLVRLWGTETRGEFRDRLDHFLHLMLAIRILSFQSLIESDIAAFEYHYHKYTHGLSELYPYESRTPTQHMGLHIPAFLRTLGPSTRLSESTCEMFIGTLQDICTNFKIGDLETTIHREFIMAARLKVLVEHGTLAEGLGEFRGLVQNYLAGKLPGRVGSGWRTSHGGLSVIPDPDLSPLLDTWANSRGNLPPPRRIYLCSRIQQGNVVYAHYEHSTGDSCVLFSHPSIIGPHPARIDKIVEDSENGRVLLLIRPYIPLSAEDSAFDPYWAHPLIGQGGAAIARLYYDTVSPVTLVVEPCDLIAHVAVCNFYDRRISQGCVAVLSLDLKHARYT